MNRLIYNLDLGSCRCGGISCCDPERNSRRLNKVQRLITSWRWLCILSNCSVWLVVAEKGVLSSFDHNVEQLCYSQAIMFTMRLLGTL